MAPESRQRVCALVVTAHNVSGWNWRSMSAWRHTGAVQFRRRSVSIAVCRQVSHYRIAPSPEKSPPAYNLPAKIRPARAAGRIFTGKLSAVETFLRGGGRSYNGETFVGPAIFK